MIRRGLLALALPFASPALAEELVLTSPVDCRLGETCFIQQYMDRDPGEGFSDFQCSTLSYDGHKGTDFALPTLADMHEGVDVLAAADGTVRGFRDGMPDTGWTDETRATVEGKECGNGVVLVHPGGWETQYCHLKQGTITIENGQTVRRGEVLGQIGQSGRSEFPHLHLSVRQGGTPVDPFDPDGTVSCDAPGDSTLWAATPAYQPGGLIEVGMTDTVPEYVDVKAGVAAKASLPRTAPAIVLFGMSFGTQAGDIVKLDIVGPDGPFLTQEHEMERRRARAFRAVGKKLSRRDAWPAGDYEGTVTLLRDGVAISEMRTVITVE